MSACPDSTAPAQTADLAIARADEGDLTVLELTGGLDMTTAARLRAQLDALAGTTPRVVLDLAGVSLLDTSGVGTIIEAQRRLRNDFCELSIRNPSPTVRHVLAVSGVEGRIRVIDTGPDPFSPTGRSALA